MSTVNSPAPRKEHTAVWTGGRMLVWGGRDNNGTVFDSGGQYALGDSDDADLDGFSPCTGDCDDSTAAVNPGQAETCDGLDDDCDGLVDDDAIGQDSDGDGVANLCDNCLAAFNREQSDTDHDSQGDVCDLDDDQIKDTQIDQGVLSAPSAPHEEIMGAIGKLSKEFWPTAVILPVMSAGATDGSYLRNAGIPTYGHSGLAGDINDVRAHGKDERVAVKSFYEGQEYLYRLVKMLSGGA